MRKPNTLTTHWRYFISRDRLGCARLSRRTVLIRPLPALVILAAAAAVSAPAATAQGISVSVTPACTSPGGSATVNITGNSSGAGSSTLSLNAYYFNVLSLAATTITSSLPVGTYSYTLPFTVSWLTPWGPYELFAEIPTFGEIQIPPPPTGEAEFWVLPYPLCQLLGLSAATDNPTAALASVLHAPAADRARIAKRMLARTGKRHISFAWGNVRVSHRPASRHAWPGRRALVRSR
jgi:hypothetical protein